MVESSGGSCRCACQDGFHQDQEQSTGCCSPHVFTSVLLGILSCVLMTGGVFLAFHRWDPMWLMVSGVGVVLILIGTVLHCCSNLSQRPKRHSSARKGCCPHPVPPDHHVLPNNNGSLTEQLLPLSNARSVSQLSLNMLPGYFPPVVTAYGIEQHSAVVQNINRLVQQQQQPQSPAGSCSPGVASNAGKSFIVLSLPGDASSANIQNLVATVYQLDGNATESSANEINVNTTTPVTVVKPNSPVPLILKNAEVQTCNIWPATTVTTTSAASTSGENSGVTRSSSADDSTLQVSSQSSATTGSTQTDDISPAVSETINLMDCSSDIAPICDNTTNTCDNQPMDNSNSALVDIPSPPDLIDVSTSNVSECSRNVLVDIPEPPIENFNVSPTTTTLLLDVVVSTPPDIRCSEVLVDISANTNVSINNSNILLDDPVTSNVDTVPEGASVPVASTSESLFVELPQSVPENTNSNLQSLNPELLTSTDNLSTADTEIDDGELMERSSPPPSYEDVTLEGENMGAFGLAYGTI